MSRAESTRGLLAMMQHGDSFFPCGAFAFSWGLEGLRQSGLVGGEPEVAGFLHAHLADRWASMDRAALAEAWREAPAIEPAAQVDAFLEAATSSQALREGGRRGGNALLQVHRRLGTTGAAQFAEAVAAGRCLGYLPTVQGFLWRGVGLTLPQAELASAHGLCVGLLGAAVRLGLLGHVAAQRVLGGAQELLAQVLEVPAPPLSEGYSYTPLADIAVMRHETMESRLFSN